MDLNPFDGAEIQFRRRREMVTAHIERLERGLRDLVWEGPNAERFRAQEARLISDLRDVERRLGELEVTARQLAIELAEDLQAATRLIGAFVDLVTPDADQAQFDDWPYRPGEPTPRPGDAGWPAFRDFASRVT